MSDSVYILGARRLLDGKLHEFGREFRRVQLPHSEPMPAGTKLYGYELRMVVIAPDGRHVGPWERLGRER